MALVALVSAACAADDEAGSTADDGSDDPALTVVATTTIWGDVVEQIVGDRAEVEVLMPVGADPHDFQASSQQISMFATADLVVANGLGLEEGLADALEAAEEDGANVLEVAVLVDPIPFGGAETCDPESDEGHEHEHEGDEDHADEHEGDEDHADEHEGDEDHADEHEGDEDHADEDHADEDHADEDHADEDHADEHEGDESHDHEGHEHGSCDPHVWTDPLRVAAAAEHIAEALAEIDPDVDWMDGAEAYAAELEALDGEISDTLSAVPADDRKMVTNHEAFGYFADRYDFTVVGTVIPGGATLADPSSGELAELVEAMEDAGVATIFTETTEPSALADAVAAEIGDDVSVVELYTGSLGEPGSGADTVVGMLRVNAERIAGALS